MAEKPAKANTETPPEEREKTRRKIQSLLCKMEGIKKTEIGTLNIGADSSRFFQKAKVFGIHLVDL